jgi:hypothetical protein
VWASGSSAKDSSSRARRFRASLSHSSSRTFAVVDGRAGGKYKGSRNLSSSHNRKYNLSSRTFAVVDGRGADRANHNHNRPANLSHSSSRSSAVVQRGRVSVLHRKLDRSHNRSSMDTKDEVEMITITGD